MFKVERIVFQSTSEKYRRGQPAGMSTNLVTLNTVRYVDSYSDLANTPIAESADSATDRHFRQKLQLQGRRVGLIDEEENEYREK